MKSIAIGALLVGVLLARVSAQVVTDHDRQAALQHYRAGVEALHLEAFPLADREFRTAAKLDPRLELAHYGIGQVSMVTKQYPAAVRAYLACREAFIANAGDEVLNQRVAEQRRDAQIQALEDAKVGYEMGIAKTANTPATIQRLQLQINQLKSQRNRGADRPEGVPAWISLALGSAYFRNEAMADAEREYRLALEAEPKLGEAHNNLAVVLMLTGRYEAADREVKAAESAGFPVSPLFKADLAKAMIKRDLS